MDNSKLNFFGAVLVLSLALFWQGCARLAVRKASKDEYTGTTPVSGEEVPMDFDQPWEQSAAPAGNSGDKSSTFKKDFGQDSDLDQSLSKHPIEIAEAPSSGQTSGSQGAAVQEKREQDQPKGRYRIQLLTVADIESAQEQKSRFSELLGGHVDIVFNAPFYKLRFGYYSSQKVAEERLLDLLDLGIQGFVVKD